MKKYNATVIVTQQLPKDWDLIVARRTRNAAFEEWRQKLSRGARLPRGRYFVGKKAGPQNMVAWDECWMQGKDVAKVVIQNANVNFIVKD